MSPRSRRTSPRSPQASRIQLRIFAEGEKTESNYLTHWNRLYREQTVISIAQHSHTTPFELVQAAAAQRREDLREAKKGRGSAFHQYWCIFDVDEHPRLHEALEMARANDIHVALSSPCVELWFLLHFENQTAYIHRHDAQARAKGHLKCGKELTEAALVLLVGTGRYHGWAAVGDAAPARGLSHSPGPAARISHPSPVFSTAVTTERESVSVRDRSQLTANGCDRPAARTFRQPRHLPGALSSLLTPGATCGTVP